MPDATAEPSAPVRLPRLLFWTLAAVIVLAGLALRLYDLGGPSLWIDEALTHFRARLSLGDALDFLRQTPNQLPLYYVTMQVYPHDSEFWLRSSAVLAGMLGVVLAMVMVRDVAGRDDLALALGALAAFSPYHVWLSRTARTYGLMFLLAVLATWAFLNLLDYSRSRRWWVVFVLASMAAYISHYFMASLALAQYVVFGHVLRRKRRVFRRWIVAQVIAGIPLLLWLVYMMQQDAVAVDLGWIGDPILRDLPLTITNMLVGFTEDSAWWVVPGALVGMAGAIAGSVLAIRERGSALVPLYAFWLAVTPLVIVMAGSLLVTPLYVDRYFMASALGMMLLAVTGWDWIARRSHPAVLGIAVGVMCLTGIAQVVSTFQADEHYKEDWRDLAAHIEAHYQPGDGILVPGVLYAIPLYYYLPADDYAVSWTVEGDPLTVAGFDQPVTRVWAPVIVPSRSVHTKELVHPHAKASSDEPLPTTDWIDAREDRIIRAQRFNGLVLFLVDTSGEASDLVEQE